MFIALEGGEGAGKSTQARLLADSFERAGAEVVLTREPGATELGRRLREILLTGSAPVGDRAEALLYAADRAQHVDEVIRPALRRGAIVITDRYVGSSLAYQGAARGMGTTAIEALSVFAVDDVWPDVTVLLDIDPVTGLQRAGATGAPDRLESAGGEFHDRVRQAFLALAGEQDWLVVDATQPADDVHGHIVMQLREFAR